MDFGWFAILAKPLFLALNWVNDKYVHNYGWSIVVVTIVINFLLLPLKFSSLKSMKKMQVLQPQIAAINEKYKNIGIRDPKKAEQNQEMMALYKRNGVNPMGGCMPLALQIPFFIAYYKVLSVSIEMRGAHWLWVTDLSQPETLAIHILPILMIGTQFLLQKMTPTTTGRPGAAEGDDADAADDGLFFLQCPERTGVILAYRKRGGHWRSSIFQQGEFHACGN